MFLNIAIRNKEPGESVIDIYYAFTGPQMRAAGMGRKEFKIWLKIQPKVNQFYRSKTILKYFLNKYKTILKNPEYDFFDP